MKLTEKYLSRKKDVRGRAVGFRIDEIRLPDGKKAVREYLDHPGAVAVIPFVDPNHIILVSQYRYPVGEITWEIPAGKLSKGEAPGPCVRRELEEETGYRSRNIRKMLSFWPTAAFANEIIHVYIARDLVPGRANPDEDEFLQCRVWPLSQVYAAIRRGKIKDSKTLIALLAYKALR